MSNQTEVNVFSGVFWTLKAVFGAWFAFKGSAMIVQFITVAASEYYIQVSISQSAGNIPLNLLQHGVVDTKRLSISPLTHALMKGMETISICGQLPCTEIISVFSFPVIFLLVVILFMLAFILLISWCVLQFIWAPAVRNPLRTRTFLALPGADGV